MARLHVTPFAREKMAGMLQWWLASKCLRK